ncbi:hypothetical protein BU17DRAFT_41760 [Hysterangium stoloniferum]|nr:hypothetical protein BU17DRAFT_41760 [Hysterangium stoloniferum]
MTSDSPLSQFRSPLPDLLDVSIVKNHAELSGRFSAIAEALLLEYHLRIEYEGTVTDFEILEIEFYLYLPDVHEDPFCHGHDDQTASAQWYFHRAGKGSNPSNNPSSAGGYRGGTRKGLDITFGSPIVSSFFSTSHSPASSRIRGGILLRSIRSANGENTIISGPSLVVDKILTINKSRNIAELVGTKLGGCISALQPDAHVESSSSIQSRLYLTACLRDPKGKPTIIYRSPRVGLDLSHPSVIPQRDNLRVQYVGKFYRYFVRPELLKVNGRCHTFVGLLVDGFLLEQGHISKPISMGRLVDLIGLKQAIVQRYTDDFMDGGAKRSLVEFVGSNGKNASSNARTFMRMMGVLHRMGLLHKDC